MVYFNQKPYTPTSKQETDQWGQVLEFKSSFPAEGLWWPYKGKTDFERLLRNHLMNFVRDNFLIGNLPLAEPVNLALQQFQLLPTAPGLLVGRDEALRDIKQRLGIGIGGLETRSPKGILIVRGWPGVGKSTVAAALAYDGEVRSAFPDGILWASLGPKPSLLSSVAAWGRALGADDLLKVATLEAATAKLAALLSKSRMLLIVDDVWETEHAAPFLRARGSACTLLLTTREARVADAIGATPEAIYNLPVLTEDSAMELLGLISYSAVAEDPEGCRRLVRDMECLPLALHVAGYLLNDAVKSGYSIAETLKTLEDGAKLLESNAPADRTDLESQPIPTVAALLKQSTDRLDRYVRDCFAYLGAFAPKPATFDLRALKNVWRVDDPRPIVQELVRHGLLEPAGNRFQMHALLVSHARSMLTE